MSGVRESVEEECHAEGFGDNLYRSEEEDVHR
jgi:hypothetical protein